jgi:LPS O-antigen subunit length determinant protein (WzzB/FepE family)
MKKNNSYIADDEIDLADLIKSLWREKILILSISIICGLAGYVYASFQPQEFKTEIQINYPPPQLFEPYTYVLNNTPNTNTPNTNTNIVAQFVSDLKVNFLSLDNVETFIEESREFSNFKGYLKTRNISAKEYFKNKLLNEASLVKEKNLINTNRYFLFFTKELDGDIFLNNYAQFIKKKTIIETKKKLKFSIENMIVIYENSLEKAKLINLENPILKSMNQSTQVVNEPNDLFYKGSKILSHEITYLKRLLIKLENDQFYYEITTDKPFSSYVKTSSLKYFAIALMIGLFLSLIIIFFKGILKNN